MNIRIFILASLFGLIETAYFGWNMFPKSESELVCDGITMILFAMSLRARR